MCENKIYENVFKHTSVTFLYSHVFCHFVIAAPYIPASHLSLLMLLSECAQVSVFFSSDMPTGLFMGHCQPGSVSY